MSNFNILYLLITEWILLFIELLDIVLDHSSTPSLFLLFTTFNPHILSSSNPIKRVSIHQSVLPLAQLFSFSFKIQFLLNVYISCSQLPIEPFSLLQISTSNKDNFQQPKTGKCKQRVWNSFRIYFTTQIPNPFLFKNSGNLSLARYCSSRDATQRIFFLFLSFPFH